MFGSGTHATVSRISPALPPQEANKSAHIIFNIVPSLFRQTQKTNDAMMQTKISKTLETIIARAAFSATKAGSARLFRDYLALELLAEEGSLALPAARRRV